MEVGFSPSQTGRFLVPGASPKIKVGRPAEEGVAVPVGLSDGAVPPNVKGEVSVESFDKETLRDVLKKTADLVGTLTMDRHLKYEVVDEAGLVQIQVIDSRDGNIVRKIPADEIVRLVTRIQETLNDRLDVVA